MGLRDVDAGSNTSHDYCCFYDLHALAHLLAVVLIIRHFNRSAVGFLSRLLEGIALMGVSRWRVSENHRVFWQKTGTSFY